MSTIYLIFPDKAEFEERMTAADLDPEVENHETGTMTLSVIGELRTFAGYDEDENPTFETTPGWHAVALGELPYGWKQFISDDTPPRVFAGA